MDQKMFRKENWKKKQLFKSNMHINLTKYNTD